MEGRYGIVSEHLQTKLSRIGNLIVSLELELFKSWENLDYTEFLADAIISLNSLTTRMKEDVDGKYKG